MVYTSYYVLEFLCILILGFVLVGISLILVWFGFGHGFLLCDL